MKRLVFASVFILLLAVLAMSANRLIGHALDDQLGPLLTRQLGLPVHLTPVKAQLLKLRASTPRLIIGDPDAPALVVTDVEVTLAWPDLLDGEIRLERASAAGLTFFSSRWPGSNRPPPHDYGFLDPWLPEHLKLAEGEYVSDSGDRFSVSRLHWRRLNNGSAAANWSQDGQAGEVTFRAKVQSLEDVLQRAPVDLDVAIALADKPDSAIALQASVQPGYTAAYAVTIDLQAAAINAQINGTGSAPWQLPDQSTTTIQLLDINRLLDLVNSYRGPRPDGEPVNHLDTILPQLHLPAHRGHVVIDVLRLEEEILRDNTFDFTSGEHGLQISALTCNGPAGFMTGELGIASNEQGWNLNLEATMRARQPAPGASAAYAGVQWLWRTGRARLAGQGDTVLSLLYSLQGEVSLAGDFRGQTLMPFSIKAWLDKRPDEFVLDSMAIQLGDLALGGSARLSGNDRRKLTLDIKGTQVDLGFLLDTTDADTPPGIAVPQYLGRLPDLDLDLTLDLENLQAPGLRLSQARATLERTAQGGEFVATARGTNFGTLDLTLQASTPPDKPTDIELTVDFAQLDIADIFRQNGLLNSRSTGRLNFHSHGRGMKSLFAAMQGKAVLSSEIRSDNNWRRAATDQELLSLSGNSNLILDGNRIVGVRIEEFDVDSIDQDLSGSLVLASDRSPWLVADLRSDMLNISGLLELLPESTAKADQSGLVPSLTRLGATTISLDVKALQMTDVTLSDVQLELASARNLMSVNQFDFVYEGLALKTQGNITWKGQRAMLESTAQLTDFDLDRFLINDRNWDHVPVSGTAEIVSQGSRVEELISNVTAYVDLNADAPTPNNSLPPRRQLVMTASRLTDGLQADIASLRWGKSDLTGSVRYYNTSPPSLDIEVRGDSLSLLPWEKAYLSGRNRTEAQPGETVLDAIARSSANLVGTIFVQPMKFLHSNELDVIPPTVKVFSTDRWSLDALQKTNITLSGQLDSLVSTETTTRELEFTSSLGKGQLALEMSAGQISSGRGQMSLTLDANVAPPSFQLTSTFEDVRTLTTRPTFPRSGFVSLQSRGWSQAELAANANGLIFLELGQGPFDYANSALLTADLATTMFRTLIPGISRQQQQLECGTVLGLFQDGQGSTPYGFAARTNQANLVGHLGLDLGTETLDMSIEARSHQGIGVSIGTMFANTVRIRGPLSNPRIVPNTTGIAWRAWAALSTGGLSILGETLVRRVWSSSDPCMSMRRIIVEQLCPVNSIAASSEMVCPNI